VLIEVGPGQSLSSVIRLHPEYQGQGGERLVVPTLRNEFDAQPDQAFLLTALAKLWLNGISIDWKKLYCDEQRSRLSLPTYPFQRQRYWIDIPAEAEPSQTIAVPAGKQADIADWFYRPAWKDTSLPAAQSKTQSTWLILSGETGAGSQLAESLKRMQQRVVVAEPGHQFSSISEQLYQIRVDHAEDYDALLKRLTEASMMPDRIVHLGNVSSNAATTFDAAQTSGFYSLIWLAQAMGKNRWIHAVELHVVSNHLHKIGESDAICASKATLQGPCRVIPQEYANVVCRSIDITWPAAEEVQQQTIDALAKELLGGSLDLEVAYRDGKRYTQRFEPVRLPQPEPSQIGFRFEGVYLIIGGMGGIGFAIADYLAREWKAKLVLVGRTALPQQEQWSEWLETHPVQDAVSRKIRGIQALESAGAQVMACSADVADEARMREVVAQVSERFGRIDGVIHGAGIVTLDILKAIQQVDQAECQRHFRPKVEGATVLARVLSEQPPDFVVLLSSLSSVLGGIGFIGYAAANQFLDAFAEQQNQLGGALWCSIDWDTWNVRTAEEMEEARNLGLESTVAEFAMSAQEGVDALVRIMGSKETRIVHSTGALNARLDQWVQGSFLKAKRKQQEPQSASLSLYERPNLPTAYVGVTNETEERIASVYRKVLGIEKVGIHDNFFDMGGTSLSALQVASGLQAEFETAVTPILLFQSPTVAELAKRLAPVMDEVEDHANSLRRKLEKRRKLRDSAGQGLIAVVGMSGRFPGARNVREFWQNLVDGRETLSFFTDAELEESGIPAEVYKKPNYVKVRSILDDVDQFDASFFGYTPREAEYMDPQHRVFLECAWEALEDAGYDSQRYDGLIGIFAGTNISSYGIRLLSDPKHAQSFVSLEGMIAHDKDSLTTMASYKLNLKGPSVAVQTFCSTSLVAVHLACQSLRSGESDMVLAGGVSIRVPVKFGYLYKPGDQESVDGHTRSFDAKAKGTVFGDGSAVVVLKRLDDAIADGDCIHAVIRGSAINNDGSVKAGYTAPSVDGQAEVVATAMATAGVTPESIAYVEGHGSATELGDPIEMAALTQAFQLGTKQKNYCALGSVKSNFGHLDRAAGVTGLIKVVQSLEHEVIPPTLHFQEANPQIDFSNSPFFVNTELRPWRRNGRPRRAGVNSLGIGGTNVHVVVEEAPVLEPSGPSRPWQLLTFSAKTPSALNAMGTNLARHLAAAPDVSLADVAFTLQQGRREFNHRRVVICRDTAGAVAALEQLDSQKAFSSTREARQWPITFMFPGLGEQYVNMAAGLYQQEPVFRATFDECCNYLSKEIGIDLREVLFAENSDNSSPADLQKLFFRGTQNQDEKASRLNQTWLAQPAVFVVEYCLAKLLMSWGIIPEALIGYSVGEFAAAAIAGSLSLQDALRLLATRAKLIDKLPGGAMLAVPVAEQELSGMLDDELSIAIISGPKMTVVSGPEQAIAAFEDRLNQKEIVSRRLQTTHAFHSKMMEAASAELLEVVKTIELNEPKIPYISNVTGTWITAEEATDVRYWARHMCQTVHFGKGISELLSKRDRILVEVGPGQGLGSIVKQHPEYRKQQPEPLVISTMRTVYSREQDQEVLLGSVGKLWLAGTKIDWHSYYQEEKRKRAPLPTYPFERQRYWIETSRLQKKEAAGKKPNVADWFYEATWREVALPVTGGNKAPGKNSHWLVFADAVQIGSQLAKRLKAITSNVITVSAGTKFAKVDAGQYEIDPGDYSHYKKLIKTLRDSGATVEHIVHLWNVTTEDEPRLEELQTSGFYSLLFLAKALGENKITGAVELDIVSNGLYAAHDNDYVCAAKSMLLGPCKVIPQECPNITSRSIDIKVLQSGSAEEESLVGTLFTELTTECFDVAVSYRNGRRLVQSFVPQRLEEVSVENDKLKQGGVYLITGGLGGVGLVLAEMLAGSYAAKVVLTTRKEFPVREEWDQWLSSHEEHDEVSAKIRKFRKSEEKGGGEILVLTTDAADEAGMRQAFATIDKRFGRIDGVFHAAGLTSAESHSIIQKTTAEKVDAHFASKVHGTLVLARLLEGRNVDFCLLYSSLAATLAGISFSAYAAANAFQEGFAISQRKSERTRWIAVNWDSWATREGEQDHKGTTLEDFLMLPHEGIEAVRRVLGSTTANHLVNSTADLQVRLDQWIYRKHLREKKVDRSGSAASYYARPNLAAAYAPANNETEERVARVLQDVLGIEKVGLHDNYFELGGNSLVSLQVIAELQKEFDTQLSPIIIFEAPTVSELAKVLGPAKPQQERIAIAQFAERRQRLRERAARSDVAIIGMAGRFPGADNVRELWQNLVHGVEGLTFFTDEELLESGVDPALLRNPNYVKARAILKDVDLFDAGVFGFSPREAELMDPQHRLMLETAWQTMEHAGYDSFRDEGSIGIFAGTTQSLYLMNIHTDREMWSGLNRFETNLGNTQDSLTTRISYKLNLKGPSLAIGTYCSTSGVAIHLACQSLRIGESDMALAGGVSVQVPTKQGYLFEQGNQGSPDGHTRTFDARAQGTVFSDGVAMVLLKRLEDALEDGDTIHAVIKGTAINNDGSLKAGFTAPSVERQAEVITLALADAGLTAKDIKYIEAHGTATELGDPIEVTALTKAFRASTSEKQICALGSIKTNIGHADRAAGAIGLIKTAEILKSGLIPPTLHFQTPNPKMDLENSPFYVVSKLREFPSTDSPRRAGVTALGVGGTNAHIIVEEAPPIEKSGPGKAWQFLTLSAKTPAALDAMCANLASYLKEGGDVNLADVAYTLQQGRREFYQRRVIVCCDANDARIALESQNPERVFASTRDAKKRPVAFMFPGVGEQYLNMAAALYEQELIFRTELDECCDLLENETGTDLRKIIFAESSNSTDLAKLFFRGAQGQDESANRLNQTVNAQPAVFIIEYCLARLLMSWGIMPEALIGYSVGEFAAATIAGSLSLPDALRLIAGRAKLIEKLPGGAMLAVSMSEQELKPLLGDRISIAICNGPKLTVVSGPEDAIAELEDTLKHKEVVSRRLQATHAFHSYMMEQAAAEFAELLKTIELKEPQIPYLSNVTGTWIKAEEATDPQYWVRHMCQTVRFGDGISELLNKGEWVFMEVGPGQSLSSLVKQRPEFRQQQIEPAVVSAMKTVYSREDDQQTLTAALAKLWLFGNTIDWNLYYQGEKRKRIPLPTYPYERQSYWLQPKKEVASLYSRISSAEDKAELADWFYVPSWKSTGELKADVAGLPDGKSAHWLIFADPAGLGERIAETVKQKNIKPVLVRPGNVFAKNDDGSFGIRVSERADYSALLKDLRKSGRIPSRIVHLWTAQTWEEQKETLQEKLDLSFYSLFHLAQAIGDQLTTDEIELCVISSDMQEVLGNEILSPEKATVKGPCKVIRQEYANVSCRSIDISSAETEASHKEQLAEQLAVELQGNANDQFVALRQGQRYVQQFERMRIDALPERSPRLKQNGVYFITGGMGGIGFAFAEYMFHTVHARLVLVGRSGLPPKEQWADLLAQSSTEENVSNRIRKVMALEESGAEILIIAADISKPDQVQAAVAQAIERFGEINGVFHAAGVPGQGLTQLKSAQTAAGVMAPKIQGTLALEEALKDVQLDFFVLASSIAAFTGGGPGQIDYCAANSYLDVYARRNFSKHGITVSMNFGEWQWDAWSEGLKGFQPELRESLIAIRKKFGIAFDEGMEAIHRVLSIDLPQIVVVTQNFTAMVETSNQCTALKLSNEVSITRKQRQTSYPRPSLATSFVAASNELERKIAEIWQRVLGIENIGIQDNFFDLGGNSLVGLQVIGDLKKELEVDITPIALYEAPTVSALARYLNPEVDQQQEAAGQELAARREQVRNTRTSPEVAIIGMAGRFPGAKNVNQFWQNISSGVESISFYSEAELLAAGVDPAKFRNPNYVRAGSDIDDIENFDAMLFGYAPREAETIDPQHRHFLQCAWEALEDAGYDPERYKGLIGIFGGANTSIYLNNLLSRPDLMTSGVGMWQAFVGNSNDSLATRVAYKLNLKGPALSVQTFCSTSGVAMHMACKSVLDGDCDMALAGGVNISIFGKTGYIYEEGGIDSPDGHTRTFDAKAKGAVVGDGVGVVLFKRLDDAIADGDHIYAVIKGSGINNDGSLKVGYTAPSVEGQSAAIAEALSIAGVEADSINYVEAHGTATELGDPIEVAALTKAFRASTDRQEFCALGSVKTNIGHLDRAAGVTGMIKTALALKNELIPPILHFESPNPNIDFEHSPFFVCAQSIEWKRRKDAVRRAGVNVVGLGGTNVHFILQEAPDVAPSGESRGSHLLLLSAKTQNSLETATENLCEYLRENPDVSLADVAYTLQVGRKKLEHRRAVVCSRASEAVQALESNDPQKVFTSFQQQRKKSVIFMFPGVGDHYPNMAADLYREEKEFREHLDRCCDLVQPVLGLDLREVLFSKDAGQAGQSRSVDLRAMLSRNGRDQPADKLYQTWLAQPAVFVVEYCLAKLLMSWGIVPQALIGYSLGEFVAATIAGCLSLQDALQLVAARAKLVDKLPVGAMLAIPLPEEEVVPLLNDQISIAICNSPKLTVVAGPIEAITELESALAQIEIVTRRLQTTHAFHSRMMEQASDEFRSILNTVDFKAPQIAYISNVTGTWIKAEEATDPQYWTKHMCQTVRFADGVKELLQESDRILVEVGPGQSLGSFVKQHPAYNSEGNQVVIPTLRPMYQNQPDVAFLLGTVAKLWLTGVDPDWTGFYSHERRLRLPLPTYPFERQRYWVEPGTSVPVFGAPVTFQGKNPDMSEWFYKPTWRESKLKPRSLTKASKAGSRWLIFADDLGLAAAATAKLLHTGEQVITVKAGQQFRRHNENLFEIRVNETADYDNVIKQLREEGRLPAKVAHFWSVTSAAEPESGAELQDFANHQDLGYYSLLAVVQAFGKQFVLDPLNIVVVSSNMQPASGDEPLCPPKSTLLGPCKGIPQENPHIVCRSVDVLMPAEGPWFEESLVNQLVDELLSEPADAAVSYRKGLRLVQDFVSLKVDALSDGETKLRLNGVYLITGGLGGVGLVLARHLAQKVQAKLVLVGRSGLPERSTWTEWLEQHGNDDATSQKILKVRSIEDLGAEVCVIAADISEPSQMKAVVEAAYQNFGALHGVVHAAGISERWAFRVAQEAGREDSEYQFRPKVSGLMALERALEGKELDFCLLTSSLSSVLAGMTLVPYASANIFMDAFTHKRNKTAALPWISVNWDTWRLKEGQHTTIGKTVLEFEMSPEEGAEAFERLIFRNPCTQIVESTGNLQARIDKWVRRQFEKTVPATSSSAKANLYARPNLQTRYIPTSNDFEGKIADIWQQVLGIETVGIHDNYFDLGGTSLSAIQVVSQLQKELNLPVSPIAIFESPTVSELAKKLNPDSGKESKQALKTKLNRRKALRQKKEGSSDIAIISTAGRFPGANSVEEFWNNISNGVESLRSLTDEELVRDGVSPELFNDPNYVRVRPMVADTDMFDAAFFGYNPREAEITDPQHRVLLEVAWEAMERAGYDSQRYDGSIGVFAGSNNCNYAINILKDPEAAALYDRPEVGLANERDSLTTTISYKLNLRGPSFCIQTFCSTSLVATHLACQSILAGECDMALAGGISLRFPQKQGYLFENNGQDSCDGHSRTFDAQATGTVFGEGVGLVLLKRLDDALADGDVIHAVIKGTAINNDGSMKVGYTAPSVEGQAEVIAMALANAGVEPSTIHYVEASGTASELGDPIEVASLTKAFRAFTDDKNYCAIGSVKPNIGHPDRAAGITGLIKTVEAMKHQVIPPTLFYKTPNPKIDFENSPFFVTTKSLEWTRNGSPRRAGVNSVGTGGTNAHVIIEEPPVQQPSSASRSSQLLLLSARTSSALETATANLYEYLDRHPETNLADVAFTLQVGRKRFAHRRAVVCSGHGDAMAALRNPGSSQVFTQHEEPRNRSVAFLFPGAGNHHAGMVSELYRTEVEFRAEVDQCCELLQPLIGFDLRSVISSVSTQHDGSISVRNGHQHDSVREKLNQPEVSHALLFVAEYAVARLLMSWGIVPQGVAGYGVGEIVASAVASALSLNDALRLVCARARLIAKTGVDGQLSEQELLPALKDQLSEQDNKELTRLISSFELKKPDIPCISGATGTWMTVEEATNPQFQTSRILKAPSFDVAITTLLGMKEPVFVEVGPGETLGTMIRLRASHTGAKSPAILPAIKSRFQEESDQSFLLSAAARLWLSGVEIDWNSFYSQEKRRRVTLPTYPFERQRFWIDVPLRASSVNEIRVTTSKRKEEDVSNWFHVPVWKQSTPLISARSMAASQPGSRWLLLVDESPLSVALVAELKSRGADLTCVRKGPSFSHSADGHYTINPSARNHYELLFNELCSNDVPIGRVLYLWSLVSPAQDRSRYDLIDRTAEEANSLLLTAQMIARTAGQKAQLLVVTSGMMKVTGDEALVPESALLLGTCKGIDQEFSNISCRAVDVVIPASGSLNEEELVERILGETEQESDEFLLAYRGSQRWIQNFERVRLDAMLSQSSRLRPDGVYLVNGGLSPTGLAVAHHLARNHAAKIVLVNDVALPPREHWETMLNVDVESDHLAQRIWLIWTMQEMGSEVLVLTANPSDRGQTQNAVQQALHRYGKINGVFHAAEYHRGRFAGANESRIKAKSRELAGLDEALKDVALDFMVLMSSISPVSGTNANEMEARSFAAYLDAYAHARSSRKRPVISISWGDWQADAHRMDQHLDAAAQERLCEYRKKYGIRFEEGMDAMSRILEAGLRHVSVCTQDLNNYLETVQARDLLVMHEDSVKPALRLHPRPALGCDYVAPRADIEIKIAEIWQEMLGIDGIGIEDNFFELGGHSLLATRLFARMRGEFNVSLSLRSIFELSTVASQAEMISALSWTDKEMELQLADETVEGEI
jgi:acyl transferase domain-containing protein/acyl carrier protein